MKNQKDYIPRHIDAELLKWKESRRHKPLLLRGPRQVGKSSSIRNLGKSFKYFIEINFEKMPELKYPFNEIRDVKLLAERLSNYFGVPVIPGETLLFIDEIQACKDALKSLWFFKEDMPELHVIAAGSLLEFALKEIEGYGVGRIRSVYMYPMSFDEFLLANGKKEWYDAKIAATPSHPLFEPIHKALQQEFRTYLLIGGMPAAVSAWLETHDYNECAAELDDIQQSYYEDFAKYAETVPPRILRSTLLAVAMQTGKKFIYSHIQNGVKIGEAKLALELLSDAGIIKKVIYSSGNGLPLGAEANEKFVKYHYLDSGLLLRVFDLELGGADELRKLILIDTEEELVNKGAVTEMVAGWELIKYASSLVKHELYYWENLSKGANAEVDYLTSYHLKVLPVEVKSGTSGKMKSLRFFMAKKRCRLGLRTSLENFGRIQFVNVQGKADVENEDDGNEPIAETSYIDIIPLYALSNLQH
jgi:hypothetical protein